MVPPGDRVVLVTGGGGFLGGHVIKELQQHCADQIKEIRILDMRAAPVASEDHQSPVKCTWIQGDICDEDVVLSATRGVSSVVHTAGLVSFGTLPDIKGMHRINVTGTSQLLNACEENSVRHFVYTSTVDVVIGYDDIINGDETLTRPKEFLFPGYPESKWQAEQRVLLANGPKLQTVCLRPNVMYGEGDPFFVTKALQAAVCGYLPRLNRGTFQQAYVGNVAWAHVCALKALWNGKGCAGRVYFVTDDTPVGNSIDFVRPFAEARGLKITPFSIPFSLAYFPVWTMEKIMNLVSPFYPVNVSTCTASILYVSMHLTFCRKRAEDELGYMPKYSYLEAMERSIPFYKIH